MSPSKKDRNLPAGSGLISDAQLAQIIASALREDFGDTPSAIKKIGRLTSANLRAIKNWYSGTNAPSSRYLLILARMSPTILRFILMQVGGEDLWDVFDHFHRSNPQPTEGEPAKRKGRPGRPEGPPRPMDVTMDVTLITSKERGDWFMAELIGGRKAKARDLAEHCNVDLRTARRDISMLVRSRRAVFRGSKRNGWYELAAQ
jgi:hypothetical protein